MELKPNLWSHKNHRITYTDDEAETVGELQHYLGHQELPEHQESLEDNISEESFLLCPLKVCRCCWPGQASEDTQHTG